MDTKEGISLYIIIEDKNNQTKLNYDYFYYIKVTKKLNYL